MDCCAFCNASSYKIKPFMETMRNRYQVTLYRDVAHVEVLFDGKTCDLFYFPYGAMVCWGMQQRKRDCIS